MPPSITAERPPAHARPTASAASTLPNAVASSDAAAAEAPLPTLVTEPVVAVPVNGHSPRGALAAGFAIVLLTIAHFAFLLDYYEPAISTPDANGYFAQARLMALEGRTWFTPACPMQYVGMHWLKADADRPESSRYFSRYPPGLPAVLAVFFRLGGPEAALLVNPAMASLTLLGLFMLCRLWVGAGWGVLAAALMAVNPIANQHALAADSHTSVSFFFVWGLYLLAQWTRSASPLWAFGAGLFFGVVPTIRYPEALLSFAAALFVALVLLDPAARPLRSWRATAAGLLGAAIPVAALALRNQLAFGAPWRTGYALTNEQTGFGWDYFQRYALSYVANLQSSGAGPVFGAGLAGIAVLCARRDTWRRGVLLAAAIVPSTLLYMAYYWGGMGNAAGTMRFLLPTFFVYALATVWLLKLVCNGSPRAGLSAAVALIAVCAAWGQPQSVQSLRRLREAGAGLAFVTRELQATVPAGSVLMTSNQLLQHLDFIGRWKLADESVLSSRMGRGMGMISQRFGADEDSPSPMQREKMEDRMKQYEGLQGDRRIEAIARDLWKWAGPEGHIYFLADEQQIKQLSLQLPWGDRFEKRATIQLPKQPVTAADVPERFRGPDGGGGDRFDSLRRMMEQRRGDGRDADGFGRGGPAGGRFDGGPGGGPGGGGPMGRFDALSRGEPLQLVEWVKVR